MFGATKAYLEKNSEYYGGLILKQEVSSEAHPASHCCVVGLFYVGLLYPLYTDLWHSKWLIEMHNEECEPMFLTFFVTLGVFLLLAARKPMQYRLVIAFAAWHSLAHSATMLIQTVEAYRHGAPRDYKDVILFGMIGIVVLLMVPSKEEAAAIA